MFLRARACAVGLALAASLYSGRAAADMRPVSDAERAGVQIAAGYLSRGPAAVAEQLALKSPLRRFKGQEQLDEIETRLGPPAGAQWELQTVVPALKDKVAVFSVTYPSGFDDTIFLEMADEAGQFKINDIRFLGQRSERPQVFPPLDLDAAEAAKPPKSPLPRFLVFGVIGIALAIGSAFLGEDRRGIALGVLAAGAAIVAGSLVLAMTKVDRFQLSPPPPPVVEKKDPLADLRLAKLLPLRRALAGHGDADAELAKTKLSGTPGDIAQLWRAQLDLQQTRVDDMKRVLKKFPSPSDIPLVEILRARLALFENDEAASAVAYEHAVNLGPGRDGLWYETAQALSVLGYDDRANGYLSRLSGIGSRDASVYYSLATSSAMKDEAEKSEAALKTGWNLRPIERSHLVEAAVLWSVLRRQGVVNTISLSAPVEAVIPSPATASRSVVLPIEAQPRISGEFLHVQIGEAELHVPGGAALAPVGTPIVDPTVWAKEEEDRALLDFPNLVAIGRNNASYAQPAMRARLERTIYALANRNRWADAISITDGLTPAAEHVPADIFFIRAIGLQRAQRELDAKNLLASLAASRVLQRKRDAQALASLGALLESMDMYDEAVKMFDRSASIRPNEAIDDRVRQIQMSKRLATRYSTFKTMHFDIHYPEDVNEVAAQQIGNILEAELTRLQKWIPVQNFRPVVVNVLWWREFRSTFTGSDFILGEYTGKIIIPFAGVQEYVPEIVAILSHELAHAMIAQATNDQAPHWFQEGLAQRIEMVPYHENAFNMYTDDKLLAISLLDAVLRGSPDPEMISEAYIEAQTVMRYMEARYGYAGVTKMIQAFRDGATTEEAIERATGRKLADFDVDLRVWGRGASRVFENPPPTRYDTNTDTDIHWTNPKG